MQRMLSKKHPEFAKSKVIPGKSSRAARLTIRQSITRSHRIIEGSYPLLTLAQTISGCDRSLAQGIEWG